MKAYIIIPSSRDASEEKPGMLASLAINAARRILPAANPDLDHLYAQVAVWHVEIDATSGEPLREIGLDSKDRIIVIGPWRENYGVIVDCNGTFDLSEYPHVSAEQFESEWNAFRTPKVV